jgi:hypothetical protein
VEVLTSVVTTVTPETPGIPRAMVYSLLRALPGEPGLFATVISGISSTDLIPASGRQDHTTSPSASGAFVLAPSTSIASRPASFDVAQRPSVGQDKVDIGRVAISVNQNIF